jgi:hypothetical protein
MKPNIPPLMFAPQSAALAAALGQRDPLDDRSHRAACTGQLDENRVASVLGDVMGHAVDYGDIYFQLSRDESWALEDGIVKEGSAQHRAGRRRACAGGEKTGFAYSDEVMLPALRGSRARRARDRRGGANGRVQAWHATGGRSLYLPHGPGRLAVRTTTRSSCSSASIARRASSIRASCRSWRASRRSHDIGARDERRHARRRRAAAGALQRQRHRRAGRPPRAGLRGRRRPFATPSSSRPIAGARWSRAVRRRRSTSRPCRRRPAR